MASIRKFTFDLRFDEGEDGAPQTLAQKTAQAMAQAGGGGQAVIAAPPPPAPEPPPVPSGPPLVYTEEDMDIAREEAFLDGHRQGVAEVQAQSEQAVAAALTACANALAGVAPMVDMARDELNALAAHVATEVCRTLLPHTAHDYAIREITALVRELMPNLCSQPRLMVRVHPEMVEPLQAPLENIALRTGFEGRLVVLDDETMTLTDARVEWPDGGAERNTSRLWAEIDQILERNIPRFSRGDALDLPLEEVKEEANPWPRVDSTSWWVPPPLDAEQTPQPPHDGASVSAPLPWEPAVDEAAAGDEEMPSGSGDFDEAGYAETGYAEDGFEPAAPDTGAGSGEIGVLPSATPATGQPSPVAGDAFPAEQDYQDGGPSGSDEDLEPLTAEEEAALAALDARLAGSADDFNV